MTVARRYRTRGPKTVYSLVEQIMPHEAQPVDLIIRSQAGDQEAFAAVFHQYKNLVYKTAYLMLGSACDAEDTLQEVFLQVHKSLFSYDPSKGAFTTWLHRITVNYCLNRRRKRGLLALSLDKLSPAPASDRSGSIEDRLGEEEEMRGVLRRLSEKLRAVVVLRYYWDLSHAEISQVLGIPLGTVKSRLDLALKTLRKELDRTKEGAPAQRAYHQREVPK